MAATSAPTATSCRPEDGGDGGGGAGGSGGGGGGGSGWDGDCGSPPAVSGGPVAAGGGRCISTPPAWPQRVG